MRFAKIPSNSIFLIFCQFLPSSSFPSLPSLYTLTNTLNSLWHFWQLGHLFPILFKNPDGIRTDAVFPSSFPVISPPLAAPPPPGASNKRVRPFFMWYQPNVSLRSICPCFCECRKFSVFPLGLSESMEWIPEFLILPAAAEPLPTLGLRKTTGGEERPVEEQGRQAWPARSSDSLTHLLALGLCWRTRCTLPVTYSCHERPVGERD